jgi:hypothetical protein
MRRRARAAPHHSLLLITLILASCQASSLAPSSESPAAASSVLPSPTTSPMPRSGSGVVRFSLALTAEPIGVKAFDLYFSTGSQPAASVTTLCGPSPAPECDVTGSPFKRVIRGLRSGAVLVYRIERVLRDASIAIVAQDTLSVQPGVTPVTASYP